MFAEQSDKWQVAVTLAVIQPVADDEIGRDVETDITDVHIDLDRLRLAQQRDDVDRRRTPGGEVRSSQDSVSPESMMSSTMTTRRPVMSRSRSLRMRTTPDEEVAEP